MKKITLAISGALLSLPMFALAATTPDGTIEGTTPPCNDFNCTSDAGAVINLIINWILAISAILAVLFLIIGGVLYVTSAGNTERAKQAKQTILYAVIGLAVILLSYVIANFVLNLGDLFSG